MAHSTAVLLRCARGTLGLKLILSTLVTAVGFSPAWAQPAQAVALHCIRTSPIPTEPGASWVRFFDVSIDMANREIDKTTTLSNGERHDHEKNGDVDANAAFTRTSVVIVEPDAVRFGYEVAPKDGTASYRLLSTIDRTTGDAVDNLSTFLCRLKANQRVF